MPPTTDHTQADPEALPPVERSRIEGALHRAIEGGEVRLLPASADQSDGLMRLELAASSEDPYLRADGWDDPWIEVLGHKTGEVDLSRLSNGAPVLANHDRRQSSGATPLAAIGKIESVRLDGDRRIRATIVLSPRDSLADLRRDIELGIVPKVSIGYSIQERVLIRQADQKNPPTYRVTRWQPFEVSLVDIPADDTVGIGRSDAQPETAPRVVPIDDSQAQQRADPATASDPVSKPPASSQHQPPVRSIIMEELVPAATDQPPVSADYYINAERARVQEIIALADQYKAHLTPSAGPDAVRNGRSVDEFRQFILQQITLKHQGAALDIGMTKREKSRYSLMRLWNAMATGDWSQAGLERECSQEVAQQMGRAPDGCFVPSEMLFGRDFNVGTTTEAGNLVQTDIRGDLMADLLRNKLVLGQLGATILTGLTNNISIPRQATGATIGTLTEIGSASESNPTIQTLTLQPKRVSAYVEPSKQALLQGNPSVEQMLRNDLIQQTLVLFEAQAINGTATSPQHNGIRFTSGIGTVVGGGNGAAPAWSHLVDLESACANLNAEPDQFSGYLINTRTRGKFKQTQFATNLPMIWQPGDQPLNGYRAAVTNHVPSNLTKGTSTTVCSAAIFGANWADEIIAFFGGADVTVDPYTKADTGQVKITINQYADSGVRQPGSFAKIEDLITS